MNTEYDKLKQFLSKLEGRRQLHLHELGFDKDTDNSVSSRLLRGQGVALSIAREAMRRQTERNVRARERLAQRPPSNPLRSATRAIDWVPLPKLRKVMKKMVADQAAHVLDLEQQQRYRAARWIKLCTWVLLVITAVAYFSSKLLGVAKEVRSLL